LQARTQPVVVLVTVQSAASALHTGQMDAEKMGSMSLALLDLPLE
jgi:hypothetical protein